MESFVHLLTTVDNVDLDRTTGCFFTAKSRQKMTVTPVPSGTGQASITVLQ